MRVEYTADFVERFWASFAVVGECLEWQLGRHRSRGRHPGGYGITHIGHGVGHRTQIRTHRVAWELTYGPIPDGLWVLHKCDNPPCGRVEHLYLGDVAQNAKDARERGQLALGERVGGAKLTEAKVLEIRTRFAAGEITKRQLARDYDVSECRICNIVQGKSWAHVGGPTYPAHHRPV